jgi:cytoskeletal protein CcmA (bactofilin family)
MTYPRILAVILLGVLTLPLTASAATFLSERTIVVSEAPEGNLYLAGTDVTVATALLADVLALGGTLSLRAPIAHDALLAGGTIVVDGDVGGDLRAVGARVVVTGKVTGDLSLAGGTIIASSSAQDTRMVGGSLRVNGGGARTVLYGADVHLAGTFTGDVEVVASDSLTLAEGTVIEGTLRYDAPQEVTLPATATVTGGVTYTGSSSYLPTVEQAKTFAIAGASVFLVVRILSLVIAAALLAGLFPAFAQKVSDRVLSRTPGRFALLALLGFAVVIATPVLIFLLLVSFVGMSVAFVILFGYLLLIMLAYLYAGIIAGASLAQGLFKRTQVTWKFAVLGMLGLYLVGTVPVIGGLIVSILFFAAAGAIVAIAHRAVFGRLPEDITAE